MGSYRAAWSQATPFLLFCVFVFSWGDLMFGIDTGSFGSLQVLPSWLRSFGDYDSETDTYSNPTTRVSIMNSVVFGGKLIGTMAFEPICERVGFKISMYISAVIQCVAIIVELTAKDWVVFTVGRVIAYVGVGIVENASPGYCSEISPAGLRGFMTGSMTVLVTVGNTWGAAMSRAFATETEPVGWIIPTAVQLIPAVCVLILVPFCPESPRYLVSKGKHEAALKSLDRLRKQSEVDEGRTEYEVQAIQAAVEESRRIEQGRWIDLLTKTYWRRTYVIGLLFWFYQTTGGQFVNTYGPTFYTQMGLGAQAFTYALTGQGVAIVSTIIGILLTDKYGRRPPIITGSVGTVICNFIVGGLGSRENLSTTEINVVVAALILLLTSVKVSFQCNSFLMASEIGGIRMRKKFMGYGTSCDVIFAFFITFVTPYLLNNPANLGAKYGYVIGGVATLGLIFAIFFVPETANRSLEEMDELFAMNLWAFNFSKAETTGVGRQIADIESGRRRLDAEKGRDQEDIAQETQSVQGDEKPSEARDEYARA